MSTRKTTVKKYPNGHSIALEYNTPGVRYWLLDVRRCALAGAGFDLYRSAGAIAKVWTIGRRVEDTVKAEGRFVNGAAADDALRAALDQLAAGGQVGGVYDLTSEGLQPVLGTAAPARAAELVKAEIAAPLKPSKAQQPADFGLFDVAGRGQGDLFSKG